MFPYSYYQTFQVLLQSGMLAHRLSDLCENEISNIKRDFDLLLKVLIGVFYLFLFQTYWKRKFVALIIEQGTALYKDPWVLEYKSSLNYIWSINFTAGVQGEDCWLARESISMDQIPSWRRAKSLWWVESLHGSDYWYHICCG